MQIPVMCLQGIPGNTAGEGKVGRGREGADEEGVREPVPL